MISLKKATKRFTIYHLSGLYGVAALLAWLLAKGDIDLSSWVIAESVVLVAMVLTSTRKEVVVIHKNVDEVRQLVERIEQLIKALQDANVPVPAPNEDEEQAESVV
jgi:hypothetical protein